MEIDILFFLKWENITKINKLNMNMNQMDVRCFLEVFLGRGENDTNFLFQDAE